MADPTKIIPNKNSSSQSWIQWHKAMKSRYGLKMANILFVKAWDKRGGAGSKGSTNELRDYMRENDVKLDTTALEDVIDTTSSGLDAIGGFFTMGKYMTIGLGVIVIGGLGMLVYNLAKSPIKSATAVASLTPARRVGKILK
jgi:hypothetical protein